MKKSTAAKSRLHSAFVWFTFACLLGCSRPPDDRTVHHIVSSSVKLMLQSQYGDVTVTIEKVEFGNAFSRTDRQGTKRKYFPCTATYSIVDAKGNTRRDAIWRGDFAKEGNKWTVLSYPLSTEAKTPNQSPQRTAGSGPAIPDSASPPDPAFSSEKAAGAQSPRG